VAAPATRDQNFFANPIRALEYRHPPAALSCRDGAHQARRASSQNNGVKCADHDGARKSRNPATYDPSSPPNRGGGTRVREQRVVYSTYLEQVSCGTNFRVK